MTFTLRLACFSLLPALASLPLGANVLYSNFSTNDTPDQPVVVALTPSNGAGPMGFAIPFTTTYPWHQRVTSIRFGVSVANVPDPFPPVAGIFDIQIIRDSNDNPAGSLVWSTQGHASGSWDGNFTLDMPTYGPVLQPGTKYWLVIRNQQYVVPPATQPQPYYKLTLKLKANTLATQASYRLLAVPGQMWYQASGVVPALEVLGVTILPIPAP